MKDTNHSAGRLGMAALVFELRLPWYNIYQYSSHPTRLPSSATCTMTTGTDSTTSNSVLTSDFSNLNHLIGFQNSIRTVMSTKRSQHLHTDINTRYTRSKRLIRMLPLSVNITLVSKGAVGEQRSLQYFFYLKIIFWLLC
jgi:hypothetical protein